MMRQINRRELLVLAALPLVAGQAEAAGKSYSGQFLSIESTVTNLLGQGAANTQRLIVRTGYDAPIVYAKQGEQVSIRVFNKTTEDVWLHFFGVRVENGAATKPIAAEGEVEFAFTPPDAGTFWFGPLLNAAKFREMGLQGMLIVDPAETDERYEDLPLILDDWLVDDDGKIEQDFRNIERAAGEGRIGNWYTINGKFKARTTLSQAKPSRLRLLNASNSRVLNLQFKGADALVLARDGQPVVPLAVPAEGLSLSPGQRSDVVLAAVPGDQVTLAFDLFEDVVEAGFLRLGGPLPSLPEPPTLPANVLPLIDSATVPREIAVRIEGGIKGGLTSATVGGEVLDLRALLEKGVAWAINGIAGPSETALFEATVGEVLILAFENKTIFDQPLALHGHLWHQLELDGQRTTGQSWRDTAVIPALSTARYVMLAERPGIWALHGLVAERSDSGLFGSFKVLDKP